MSGLLTITKWGNGAAIRINKKMLKILKLKKSDALNLVKINYSQMILEPVRPLNLCQRTKDRYKLDDLLPKNFTKILSLQPFGLPEETTVPNETLVAP